MAAPDEAAVAIAEPGRLPNAAVAATDSDPRREAGIDGNCNVSTLGGRGAPGATFSLSAGALASGLTGANAGGITALKLALRLSRPAGGERDRARLARDESKSRFALNVGG